MIYHLPDAQTNSRFKKALPLNKQQRQQQLNNKTNCFRGVIAAMKLLQIFKEEPHLPIGRSARIYYNLYLIVNLWRYF